MMRILVIPSGDYLGRPFPQRENQIFERLNDNKKFEVHVVRFGFFRKAKLESKCVIHELSIEAKLSSAPAYYLLNAPSYVQEILKIVRYESIDIIVAENLLPPLFFCLFKQSFRYRVPLIFDLQDYFPTSAAGYICNVNSPLGAVVTSFFESVVKLIIRMANTITTPGIALYNYAKRMASSKNVFIIPNGVSEHFFEQYDGNKMRKRLGINEEDIIVGYVGSIEFWLDLKPLIKSIAEACRQGYPVRFLVIGKPLQTKYWKKVNGWIKEYGINNVVTWLGAVPYEELPRYISALDVGVIPFDVKNPTAYYAAPIKLWEYLSQGIIVAATPIPETLAYRKFLKIVKSESDYLKVIKEAKTYIKNKESLEMKKILGMRTWSRIADYMREVLEFVLL
jgi:glycosyltransferase involved in cell wall biosynthesis